MLLDEIALYIEQNIHSLIDNETLFKNHYPDSPDMIVSVIDSGGFPPNLYTPTREKTFEIKIRSSNYDEGVILGEQIMSLFHSKNNYLLGGFFIYLSRSYSDLSYLYADSKNRDEFSLELAFLYKKSN